MITTRLSKKEKAKSIFYYALRANSKSRRIIEEDPSLIEEFLAASAITNGINNNYSKNTYLFNALLQNSLRDCKRREREIHRINTYIKNISKIEKECFAYYLEHGYSSHTHLKFTRKLFISILTKYMKSDENISFKRSEIHLSYLIKFYRENPHQMTSKMLYLPVRYIDNTQAEKRLIPLFNKCVFKISKVTQIYTRCRFGKFGLSPLAIKYKRN